MTALIDKEHLHGVLMKIVRANEHIDAMQPEIMGYLESCRDITQLPTKINPEKNTIRLTFKPLPKPPLPISMKIGDCVHNTRCALDHLWKRLGRDDNFPLFCDIDGPNNWKANMSNRLEGVPVDAHAIIDRLQPCHEGKNAPNHPLAILNKLDNIDKHDAIHVTRPRSRDTSFAFREKGSSVEAYVVRVPVVFHDQTEVIITDVPPDTVKPGMDVNITGFMFVSFKDVGASTWGDQPVQEVLRRCSDFVKHSVIGALHPYTS